VSLVVALVLDAVDGLGGDLSVIPGRREHRRAVMEGARWGRCQVGLCGDSVDGGRKWMTRRKLVLRAPKTPHEGGISK
jgi:hypothetical protein